MWGIETSLTLGEEKANAMFSWSNTIIRLWCIHDVLWCIDQYLYKKTFNSKFTLLSILYLREVQVYTLEVKSLHTPLQNLGNAENDNWCKLFCWSHFTHVCECHGDTKCPSVIPNKIFYSKGPWVGSYEHFGLEWPFNMATVKGTSEGNISHWEHTIEFNSLWRPHRPRRAAPLLAGARRRTTLKMNDFRPIWRSRRRLCESTVRVNSKYLEYFIKFDQKIVCMHRP